MKVLGIEDYAKWVKDFLPNVGFGQNPAIINEFVQLASFYGFMVPVKEARFYCYEKHMPIAFSRNPCFPADLDFDIGLAWTHSHAVQPYNQNIIASILEMAINDLDLPGPIVTDGFIDCHLNRNLGNPPVMGEFAWLQSPVCISVTDNWEEHLKTHRRSHRAKLRHALRQFEERGYRATWTPMNASIILRTKYLLQEHWGRSRDYDYTMLQFLWGMAVGEVNPANLRVLAITDKNGDTVSISFDLFDGEARVFNGIARSIELEHNNIGTIALAYTIKDMVETSKGERRLYDPTCMTNPAVDPVSVYKRKIANTNSFIPCATYAHSKDHLRLFLKEEPVPPYYLSDLGWFLRAHAQPENTIFGWGI